MKKLFLLLALGTCTFISCKKQPVTEVSVATPEQLAAVNTQLSGSWAVAGILKTTLDPYNGSLVFDSGSIVTLTNFADTATTAPYTITGDGSTHYININTKGGILKSKIAKLTADTLKLQSILNNDVSFNETFVKANATEVNNKIFKINITPFTGGTALIANLDVSIKIYVTPKNGPEALVVSQNVNQAYTYQHTPNVGDHIRIAIINREQPGNPPVLTCLATYKGLPIGGDWRSTLFSSLPDKSWNIRN